MAFRWGHIAQNISGFSPKVSVTFSTCTGWTRTQSQSTTLTILCGQLRFYTFLPRDLPQILISVHGQAGKKCSPTTTTTSPSLGTSLIIPPGAANVCGSDCLSSRDECFCKLSLGRSYPIYLLITSQLHMSLTSECSVKERNKDAQPHLGTL